MPINPSLRIDMLAGVLTLALLGAAVIALIPDLALWFAQSAYAHSQAMRAFYRWQWRAFREYLRVYRRAAQEARASR